MKKNTKATPYLLYTYSKIEIESPFFSQLCLFLSFGRLFHPPFVCVFFSFLSISIRFRISFFLLFYAITIRANSLTYDVIYTLWNEINFNAKRNFRSLFDRYTQYTHTHQTHGTHTTNEQISKRKSFVCMKFISSFVRFSVYFFIFSKKKLKRKRLSVISLIDTDNGKQHWTETPDCHEFSVFVSLVLSVRYSACIFFHPGRMADLPFLHCIWNMNDLGVNSILRHFTKDPISASTTDFDFFAIFFFVAFLPFYIAFT